jgi:Protein of unknown function (DUF3995)
MCGSVTAMQPITSAKDGPSPERKGLRLAQAACFVGLLYAAVSVYWGLGGTWLVDTVGGSLEQQGRAGNASVILAAWAAAILKTIAAVLPLLAIRRLTSPVWNRNVWALAWIEAVVLTIYGLVLTAVGLLVQADVIHASATADHQALAWHAYLWDPWFLIWGLLVASALLLGRHRRGPPATGGNQTAQRSPNKAPHRSRI